MIRLFEQWFETQEGIFRLPRHEVAEKAWAAAALAEREAIVGWLKEVEAECASDGDHAYATWIGGIAANIRDGLHSA